MRICLLIAGAETLNGFASSATVASPVDRRREDAAADWMGQGTEDEIELMLVIVNHQVKDISCGTDWQERWFGWSVVVP